MKLFFPIPKINKFFLANVFFGLVFCMDLAMAEPRFENNCSAYVYINGFKMCTTPLAKCSTESWAPTSRFVIKNDVAYDKKFDVTWKRCSEGLLWNGSACVGKSIELSWEDAASRYSKEGNGWRLPNIEELASIRSGNDSADNGSIRFC